MKPPDKDLAPLRDFSRSLPMALLRAREAVMARFRPMLRAHDLSEQQWRVLRALAAQGPQRASELSAATLLSTPSLSRLLPVLVQRDLIRREPDPADLRATRISITAAGERLVAVIAPASEAIYAELAAAIGSDDMAALYRLLARTTGRLAARPALRT